MQYCMMKLGEISKDHEHVLVHFWRPNIFSIVILPDLVFSKVSILHCNFRFKSFFHLLHFCCSASYFSISCSFIGFFHLTFRFLPICLRFIARLPTVHFGGLQLSFSLSLRFFFFLSWFPFLFVFKWPGANFTEAVYEKSKGLWAKLE